jgi:hypothetical protein
MNKADKSEFDLIHNKIDDIKSDIVDLKTSMSIAHDKTDDNLRFIKENMFNPHEGLWAETKQNTQFRVDTQKWRGIIGVSVVGLFIKQVYDLLK